MEKAATVDALVEEVLSGQTQAYREIIRRYQKGVWKVVVAMLHDFRATEDLVQQVFINAYTSLGRYQRGSDFEAWIKGLARNRVRQELRTQSRATRRLGAYREQLLRQLEDHSAADRQEEILADALRHCQQGLPDHATRMLDLRYGEGLDFGEIARIVDRSVEAVRQLLFRVRLSLKECIEKRMAHS